MAASTSVVVSVFDVEPRFIGGTETYARELSRQLGRHGWRSVLCFVTPPSEEVRRFLDLPNVSLEVLGHELTRFNVKAMARLVGVFRNQKARIAHFHYVDLMSPYPWLAWLGSAERVFFTDHGSRPDQYRAKRAPLLKQWIARATNWPVSRVICVSDYGQRTLVQRGLVPGRLCQRIYNGVDLSRVEANKERALSFRRRFDIPDGRILVTQVSWIIPEKGILDLLEAARLVVQAHKDSHFAIVGEGPFRREYMIKSRELGLQEHVTWTGLVEDPFRAGVYDAADIVCQPSRWEEVFGWVIAEAMAYGRPVVGTRVGGIPEVISDQESGFLVERGDTKALAEKILALIEEPSRRVAMGAIGRERVGALFDLKANVGVLIESYGIVSSRGAMGTPL